MNNDLEQFSEERLKQLASGKYAGTGLGIQNREVAPLARIALAAKQAKPVRFMAEWSSQHGGMECDYSDARSEMEEVAAEHDGDVIDLYTTPQPAHTEQDGWIKCSEQLPPDDDFVLIWPLPDFGVDLHVGQYMKFHKKGAGWFAQVNEQNYGIEWYPIAVTHWMKLPATPKPESE